MTTITTATATATTTGTTTTIFDNRDYDKKIKLVTTGLQGYHISLLKKQSNQNAMTIIDYLLALNTEVKPSLVYKANQVLIWIATE
jgi:hypothetical protein